MICPSCGYDNIEGADRCEDCMTSLRTAERRADAAQSLARSVMEDDLRQLEQEFLGVTSDTPAIDAAQRMKDSRLGCVLVIDNGKLVGIFTERVISAADDVSSADGCNGPEFWVRFEEGFIPGLCH